MGWGLSCPSLLLRQRAQRAISTHVLTPTLSGNGFCSAWLCLCRREWVEDTQLWIQQVSSTPSTRMDVVHLQEQLDLKLQQRQARETGICPVRRELYSQCFGEWPAGWGTGTVYYAASFPPPSAQPQALRMLELKPTPSGIICLPAPVSPGVC